jgi:hypothetical protein
MSKLLTTYRTEPTAANHAKLQAYINKHTMAVCMLAIVDQEFLRLNKFSI